MFSWSVTCRIETCLNAGLVGKTSVVTETNDTPEIVCGACGNTYTDLTSTILEE